MGSKVLNRNLVIIFILILLFFIITGCSKSSNTVDQNQSEPQKDMSNENQVNSQVNFGTKVTRGFTNDNVYHSNEQGDIHSSLYVPESYDGTKPYALFITLPGWEGLYFQGVGANMVEDFGIEALQYNEEMIVISPQLSDWQETSANQTIALTQYFLENYNIDPNKVYLHGMSGGETGSLVMGIRPDLYTAYLMTSSK